MSKTPKKKGFQELILSSLSGKKALKEGDLIKDLETQIEQSDYPETKTKPKYLINKTIKKMIEDNLIQNHQTAHSHFLSLTSSGRQRLRNIKLSSEHHLISTSWDGYWRIVIVNIPETRKKEQDAIRYILKKAQFVQIKNAVWISPFPLEHMIIGMKQDMGIDEDIIVMVSNKIDTSTEKVLIEKFAGKKRV